MQLQLGDFVLGLPSPKRVFLSVWLADLAPMPGVPPAVIWARGFRATLAPSAPSPTGTGRLLGVGGAGAAAWALWSEHANHKILPDSLPPSQLPFNFGTPGDHIDRGGLYGHVRLQAAPGERAALQLAFRSSVGLWGRWRWSGWLQAAQDPGGADNAAPSAEPTVSIQQVGFVNITSATAPYGCAGMTPDPLTPLQLELDDNEVGSQTPFRMSIRLHVLLETHLRID